MDISGGLLGWVIGLVFLTCPPCSSLQVGGSMGPWHAPQSTFAFQALGMK